jgi:DNA processing protein
MEPYSASGSAVFRRAAISWARSRELTPQRVWPLLRSLGGIEQTLSASEGDLAHGLGSSERARALLRSASDREADRYAEDLRRSGIEILTAFDEEYPRPLFEIADPPFVLYASGNLARLGLPAVAVVGSRAASRYGREVATQLSRNLSLAGICVVSGFARGVDTAAHEAAREGPGGTIAVLGCGLDVDYPRENSALKAALSKGHLLLSEHPPGVEPASQHFPIRNRIIAGLAAGVVIVEASRRSGSLITARLAADFGRDVFAVPGSVFSVTSAGTHELLRDGAILCRGAEDVLAELFPAIEGAGPLPRAAAAVPVAVTLSQEARRLLDVLIRDGEASADELGAAADLPAATVLAALFELEAAGLAGESRHGRFSLADPALHIRPGP